MKRLCLVSTLALFCAAGGAQAQACPDWSGQGQQLTYGAADLLMGQSNAVVAGGNVDLSQCNIAGGAYGHVITTPDFDFALTDNPDGMALIASVQGECDTVLLINDANGTWNFGDDTEVGLDPVVVIPAAPVGTYDIWVGTFGTTTCNAMLTLALEGGEGGEGGKDGGSASVAQDPGTMEAYRAQVGEVYQFEVTGSTANTIWGSGIYSDDSALATAAVHAGVLMPGETGVVTVELTGAQASFVSALSNGVQSAPYGEWGGSYQFLDETGTPISVAVAPAGGGAASK